MTPEEKKEEERKKGAVPLTLARGGKGVARFAQGGAGTAGAGAGGLGVAGIVLGKAGILILMTTMGIGAWGVGQYLRPGNNDFTPKTKVGADRNAQNSYDVDPRSLPSDGRGGGAMMVVPTSLDGKTEEQRLAEAAAAEAAAKAEAEQNAKAEEPKAPDAAAGVVDAAAAAAAAAGAAEGGKKTFANKFGTLSTLGAGKAGASQLSGGAGNFGGVGQNFGQKLGGARGFGSSRTPGRASARVPRGAPGKRAFRQLQNANALSRVGATAATGETAVATADRAFSNNPGANSAITGAGASPTNAGGSGSGGSSMPTNPGGSGPIGGTESPGGGGTTTPTIPRGQDVSPWKMAAMAGGAALLIAGVLLMASALVAKTATPASLAMAKMLAMAALAMGVIATLCGVAIMGMGQTKYGLIMTGGGALISVLAYMAMTGYDQAQSRLTAQTELASTEAQTAMNNGSAFKSPTTGESWTFQNDPTGPGAWTNSNGTSYVAGQNGAPGAWYTPGVNNPSTAMGQTLQLGVAN